MQSVGALGIIGGSQLLDLEGFRELNEVKGSFTVGFCPRIKTLKGLGPDESST